MYPRTLTNQSIIMKIFYSFIVLSFLLDSCLCSPFIPDISFFFDSLLSNEMFECAVGEIKPLLKGYNSKTLILENSGLFLRQRRKTPSQTEDENVVKFFLSVNGRWDKKSGPFEINPDTLDNNSKDYGVFSHRETIIIIHGFGSDRSIPEIGLLRERFFENGNYNIIVVDWSAAQSGFPLSYVSVVAKLNTVAESVSKLLRSIEKNGMGQLNQTTIVGHSLGAHIAGIIGSKLGGRISRIVGLDPAGPLFTKVGIDERLSKDDARQVEVIHTDIDGCGLNEQMGLYDFYVNDGLRQPNCLNHSCSHSRVYQYFAESLDPKSKGFYGKACRIEGPIPLFQRIVSIFYSNHENCRGKAILMGGSSKKYERSGKYHVETNSLPPYAQGQS